MNEEKFCGNCKYFIGGGDFSLCCSLKHDLTYEYSKVCDKFEEGIHWKRQALLDSFNKLYKRAN